MGTGLDAGASYARGVELANRGRYTDAKRVLAEASAAAERDGDRNLTARIAGTTAYVLARTGDVDAGERLCLDALGQDGLDAVTIAQLHGQLGALALERGLLDDAAAWLDKSIRGLRDEPVRQANMRINRSLVDMQRGQLDTALADLAAAEQAYREAGMTTEANLAVHNRGYTLMLAGDLVAALQTMQSVREPLDDASTMWAAVNELDRAEVLREAGLVTEAERSLSAVSAAFGRHRAPRDRATADYHLARSLLSHDPARAAAVAAASARRFAAIGSPGWAVRADAIGLRARLAVGRLDRSGMPVRVARRLPSRAKVAAVAEKLEAQGFRSEAEALRLTDALARLRANRRGAASDPGTRVGPRTPLEVGLLAHELRAARAADRGREGDTRRHAAAGLDLLDRNRQSFGSLDLQVSAAMRGIGLATTGLSSALRSGSHAAVFEWSERARALTGFVLPLRPPPDPQLAADLAELRVLRTAHPDGDWLSDRRASLLSDRARQRQWSQTAAGEQTGRASLDDAVGELGDGEVLVSYVFDGNQLAALVVSKQGSELVGLDWAAARSALGGLRADLDMSATVVGPMAAVVRRGLDARLETLSQVLCTPVDGLLRRAERVLITAPGVLSGVPWMMLPALRRQPISIASSVSAWLRERSREWTPPGSAGFAAGPRVARGEEEVTAGSAAWRQAEVRTGVGATVADVTALASRVDVLHVAAHGRHAADNPMFSGLELADGALFGYDIDLIPRVPDTVVLSACEVGRSSVRWGEEALGMTRIWLHAGTRSVIAAPVVVADDNACELLGAVHEGLAAGTAPSVALAEASERTGIVAPFQVHGAGF
ncbi:MULTISPECIES: CHAT domain-containing protein [unclassified Microbacterium]|uniref:CHAT domain-containing protein n=1 Tax=unclassified Microbacterium TaxID=2609290 RepID=UPI00300FB98B